MVYNKNTRVRVRIYTTNKKSKNSKVAYITYGDYRKKKNKNPNKIFIYNL